MHRPTYLSAIAFTCAALVGTSANCGEGSLPSSFSPSLGEAFELRVGEAAAIEGTDLSLTFIEVASDSRCPEDVDCLRAGEAIVLFQAKATGGPSEDMTFKVPPKGSAASRFQQYEIGILGLEPPTDSQRKLEQDEYVAEVRVSAEATK
jgi:hypothetical protein